MLNFSNLNDVEFEYLCKDIMSRKLNIRFQRFTAGRDGGIDLFYHINSRYTNAIIVQIKHYMKSPFSSLITSLKKELDKLEKWNPSDYYICCSKELTIQNKKEIYQMFSKYMRSIDNIIDLVNISDFLDENENSDILKKHFKLWLESTNILTNMFSNDIFIDSEVLISDIKDDVKMFVRTDAFDDAVKCLEKNNVVVIIGNPGVGKTITSKMIVLNYVGQGYKVRYTTDGANLSDLKKGLSQNPDEKEIILLDDCFGQAYFNMKETQENELIQLIKFVYLHKNKKLLLNSRVTIYQEARVRTFNLLKSENRNEFKVYTLDVSKISELDKAKIFYNHLYFCEIPEEYRADIIKEKRYFDIIKHPNYNPRIIEFVTNKVRYETINPNGYYDFIMRSLNNPREVWKNEYDRRLDQYDRIFLNTLYSLTDLYISSDVMKGCFNKRISVFSNIDTSVDYFNNSLKRLSDSMIKLTDMGGVKVLSASNPSVNDFLSANLEEIPIEKNSIIDNAISVHQFERLLTPDDLEIKIKSMLIDHTIDSCLFDSDKHKKEYILYYCLKYQICDLFYKQYIDEFILKPHIIRISDNNKSMYFHESFKLLFNKKFFSYYQLDNIIYDLDDLGDIILELSLEEAVIFINEIDYLFEDNGNRRKNYINLVKKIFKELIENNFSEVEASDYSYNVEELIEHEGYSAENEIEQKINDIVYEEIHYYLSSLPDDIEVEKNFIDDFEIKIKNIYEMIEGYMEDHSYDSNQNNIMKNKQDKEIELIFERK